MKEKKNITFEDAIKVVDIENVILKRKKNNILLSDYQEEVLKSRGINYNDYGNERELLFAILEYLNEVEDDELDLISSQLAEFIYYHDTNKWKENYCIVANSLFYNSFFFIWAYVLG